MDKKDKKILILFFTLTFTISWPIWILSGVLTREGSFVYDYSWLFAQVGVFAPSLSAIILTAFKSREIRKICFRILLLFLLIFTIGISVATDNPSSVKYFKTIVSIAVIITAIITIIFFSYFKKLSQFRTELLTKKRFELKWIFSALVFFPIIFLIGWSIVNFQGQGYSLSASQDGFLEFLKILSLLFSMNLILGGSTGEELGWRGFALPLLLKNFNPIVASLILGIIWACWHFPIDITSVSTIGVFVFIQRIIWTLPITIIFTWFYMKTNGSLLIAILLHTSINVLPDLGFHYYEESIMVMTLLLIIVASIVSFRTEMSNKIKEIY